MSIDPLRAVESDVKLGSVPRKYQSWYPTQTSTDFNIQGGRRACDVTSLTNELQVLNLPQLIDWFLCEQLDGVHEDPNHKCPRFAGHVCVFNCATVTFHTPSDPSNDEGVRQEVI